MKLSVDILLRNNFLLCDLIEDEFFYNEVISELEIGELKKIYDYISVEENSDMMKRLLTYNSYSEYQKNKSKVPKYDRVTQLGLELVPYGGLSKLFLSCLKDLKDIGDSKKKVDTLVESIGIAYKIALEKSLDKSLAILKEKHENEMIMRMKKDALDQVAKRLNE